MKPLSPILPFAILLTLASRQTGAVEKLPGMDAFTISYWWGPPQGETTIERYRQVAEAGFNLAGVPCPDEVGLYHPYFGTEMNLRVLDLCQEDGIKALVVDERVLQAFHNPNPDEWKSLLKDVVADYKDHPALAGYYIVDEPNAPMFAKLGEMTACLRAYDPEHYSYINLFPNYAPSAEVLKTADYREYVERFVNEVKPSYICYDHYHFLDPKIVRGEGSFDTEEEQKLWDIAHATGPRETLFFENIEIVRDVAQAHNLPFMVIVLLVPHGPYRELTEPELRWEAFQSLAYGASGVSFFSY